jgi:hypothetical protein
MKRDYEILGLWRKIIESFNTKKSRRMWPSQFSVSNTRNSQSGTQKKLSSQVLKRSFDWKN